MQTAQDAAADTGVAASNATEGVSIEASTPETNAVAASADRDPPCRLPSCPTITWLGSQNGVCGRPRRLRMSTPEPHIRGAVHLGRGKPGAVQQLIGCNGNRH